MNPLQKLNSLILICLLLFGCKAQNSENEIFVFSNQDLFKKSKVEDLYSFYDNRTGGYGLKSGYDTSRYVVEPIFELVDLQENYIRLYFDLNKNFNSPLAEKIKKQMPVQRTGVVLLLADLHGIIRFGINEEIPNYAMTYCSLLPVVQNNLKGCINREGKTIVPYEYEDLSFLDTNLIWITKTNKCGLMDSSGKIIVPLSFDMIDFPRTLKDGVYGMMNKKGKMILDGYEEAYRLYDVTNNYYFYCGFKNSSCDLFNNKGLKIASFANEKVTGVDGSLVTLYKSDSKNNTTFYRHYNLKTKTFFGEGYDDSNSSFKEFKFGTAIVAKSLNSGVIDGTGKLIIPCEYVNVDIGKSVIIASKYGKSYLFDKQGKQLLEYPFHQLDFVQRLFNENELFAYSSTGMGIIDLKGKILIEPNYDTSFYTDINHFYLFDKRKNATAIYTIKTKKLIDVSQR